MTTRNLPVYYLKGIIRLIIRFRLLWIVLLAFLFLSGCVDYDIGIRFNDAQHGTITHIIRVEATTNPLSQPIAASWFDRLEQQAKRLGGSVRHPLDRELVLTMPFHNAKDLEAKANQLLQVNLFDSENTRTQKTNESLVHIDRKNLLIAEHYYLKYVIDLRSIDLPETVPDLEELLNLELTMKTPWGANVADRSLAPILNRHQGRQLSWQLKADQLNHIEADFWVPSPLGIGFVVIVGLVMGGWFVKTLMTPAIEMVQ